MATNNLKRMVRAMCFNQSEDIVGVIFLILVFVAPTSFMVFKLILMCILVSFNYFRHRYSFLPRHSVIYFILTLILLEGSWTLVNGILQGTLSLTSLIAITPFHIVWPILLFLLFPCVRGEKRIEKLGNIIVVSHILILIFLIYNFIAMIKGLPILHIKSENEVFLYEDSDIGIAADNLHQLLFTTPFLFTLGFVGKVNRWCFVVVGILTILMNYVTRRTALLFTDIYCLLFIPFVLYFLFQYKIKRIKRLMSFFCILTVIFGVYIISHRDYYETSFDYYAGHFNSQTDIRYNQRNALTKAWLSSPITGVGPGTKIKVPAQGLVAGFESTYHAKLASNGLIGFLLFATYIMMIVFFLYRKALITNNPYYHSFLMSIFMYLIAAFTNPIIGTFDRLVPLYMCIACLLPELKLKNL